MTNTEAIELAKKMREAGVQRFVLTKDRFSAVLLPPTAGPVSELAEKIGELTTEQRTALIEQAKRDMDADLYGAAT